MHTKRLLFTGLMAFALALAFAGVLRAQAGSVHSAFQTARSAVDPELQGKVVSLYGIGTPAAIQKWYVIFYDPAVASHGRAVLVENGQIAKTYPANGGVTYKADRAFDPARISDEGPALRAAQVYAGDHSIAYDSVRALLKQTGSDQPFCWRVELLNGGAGQGFVYVNAQDNTVVTYAPAGSAPSHAASASGGSGGFAHDVEKTFRGVGADLEQFFTGERTVDKN